MGRGDVQTRRPSLKAVWRVGMYSEIIVAGTFVGFGKLAREFVDETRLGAELLTLPVDQC